MNDELCKNRGRLLFLMVFCYILTLWLGFLLLLAQAQDLGNLVKDLGVVLDTGEEFRSGARGKDGYVLKGVDSDGLIAAQCAGFVNSMGGILGVSLVDCWMKRRGKEN